jgi:hypothetical protein
MKSHQSNEQLDELISQAVSRERPTFEFDKWKRKHKDEVHMFKQQTAGEQTLHSAQPFNIRRTIMKSRITKLAAAALIIIAVLAGIYYSGGSVDPATIAWAAVTKRVAEVDLLHFYQIEVKGKDMKAIGEGWYAYGKLAARHYTGKTIYDDGVKEKTYSPDKTLVGYSPSQIAEGLLKALTFGTFSDDNEEFRRQVPVSVGEDFLIYNFSPPSGS